MPAGKTSRRFMRRDESLALVKLLFGAAAGIYQEPGLFPGRVVLWRSTGARQRYAQNGSFAFPGTQLSRAARVLPPREPGRNYTRLKKMVLYRSIVAMIRNLSAALSVVARRAKSEALAQAECRRFSPSSKVFRSAPKSLKRNNTIASP